MEYQDPSLEALAFANPVQGTSPVQNPPQYSPGPSFGPPIGNPGPVQEPPSSRLTRLEAWLKKHEAWLIGGGVALALVIVLLIVMLMRRKKGKK